MYIHSVKLVNFKSFGDYSENEVIIEPNVTVIIGKNESGKSNILEGLSMIRFLSKNDNAFIDNNINRNTVKANKYIITLKPTKAEIEKGIVTDTIIEITKNNQTVLGGLLEYYITNKHSTFVSLAEKLNTLNDSFYLTGDEQRKCLNALNNENLDIWSMHRVVDFLYRKYQTLSEIKKIETTEFISNLTFEWLDLENMIPSIYFRRGDKQLKHSYSYDEVSKELSNPSAYPNSLLNEFVRLIGMSNDDFLYAVQSGINPLQISLRDKIPNLIDIKINEKFKNFYKTETISLKVAFNNGYLSFIIKSNNGEALLLSERSNGLKWYLETFIDAQAHNIENENVLYLFDEPGISLHVNAQKELLNMFNDLAEKGNQVVYTTHSPYMLDLDTNGIHRIRAVIKDKDGFSYIYKSVYDKNICKEKPQDTLAPIITAIGMNLGETIGPAKDKINIVTEGTSDYIYLKTMAKLLKINTSKFVIIPNEGVSKCVNICMILHGWGCKYIALFDYDKAGVESGGEIMRNDMCLEMNKHYCYVADVSQDDIDKKTYKKSCMVIEDIVTQKEIERFKSDSNIHGSTSKPLLAKMFANAVEDGTFIPNAECCKNFKSLFDRITSYSKQL